MQNPLTRVQFQQIGASECCYITYIVQGYMGSSNSSSHIWRNSRLPGSVGWANLRQFIQRVYSVLSLYTVYIHIYISPVLYSNDAPM
ncbi:hypothetical protein I7I53_08836 [Histoplasma capsulatum var. duboisii H88]|uniref:Uncharacterized protein n=1 Tax=Ajellomyces capsulatus (strain H88) TaxID=544711 RepID=A0A8A1L9K9_AJEC8|nr:hypothetical protein I7I53_08836 [Histoplasma capsulatum var. duboisii H88]